MEPTMNVARIDTTPWYRQRWPWLVMLPPIAAIVGCTITIVLAVRSADGVVAADYYKRGLGINTQLARSEAAARAGLRAEVWVDGVAAGETVRLRLAADQPVNVGPELKIRLVHPGRDGADREAILRPMAASSGVTASDFQGAWGKSAPIPAGVNWRVVIEGGDWRLDGDGSRIGTGMPIVVAARR
jgi:hypothetical protein